MKSYRYSAIFNQQRSNTEAPQFLLFTAKASEIAEWASIERHTSDTQNGPQRLPKPAKVAEVKRFFDRDSRNTIPTALLVSLSVDLKKITPISDKHPDVVSVEWEIDETNKNERPGIIIDGQHRLLGAIEFEPNVPLNVVALVNASSDETAFQFLVVNNKASKVSSNHLRAVVSKYQEDALNKRLMAVRMSISQHLNFVGLVDTETNSPFRGKIDWSNNPEGQGFIAPNAIESSIAYLKQKRVPELEDDAILLGFFLTIWMSIQAKWPDNFKQDGHLLEKVPILCLTQFLADNVIFEYDKELLDITDFTKVAESVSKVLNAISPKFWEAKWLNKSLDTATGRNLLLESLTQIRRNMNAGRSWYDNVPIVDLQSDLF